MKYLIIDAEKLKTHWTLWERLNGSEYLLSPEETEEVFKSVWDTAYKSGESDMNNAIAGFPNVPAGINWNGFKKTL